MKYEDEWTDKGMASPLCISFIHFMQRTLTKGFKKNEFK
jgi:hypothetical protein